MFIDNLHALTSARLSVSKFDASVQAAALALFKPGVDLVVVCCTRRCAQGVLSKSDIVRHIASSASSAAPVSDLMTRSFVTCRPQDDLHRAWQIMSARGLHSMPVVDEKEVPIGILNIRDTLKSLLEQEEILEQMLLNYVTGVGYR